MEIVILAETLLRCWLDVKYMPMCRVRGVIRTFFDVVQNPNEQPKSIFTRTRIVRRRL